MTVWCDTGSARETFAALQRLLKQYGIALSATKANKSPAAALGLMVWLDGNFEEFMASFRTLWKAGCRRFVVFSPIADHDRLWNAIPNDQYHTFRTAWPLCSELSPETI